MRDRQSAVPQSELIDRGIRRLRQLTHTALVERLGLTETPIPQEFALAEGSIGASAVTMHTRRYGGAQLAPLTVAVLEVDGRLCSLTVIGLPPPGSRLPVLGLDLIALRGSLSLLAIDLSPTDPEFFTSSCAAILKMTELLAAPAIVPRKRPAFAETSFSSGAIIAGARAGQEETVFNAVEYFLEQTGALLRGYAPEDFLPDAAERRIRWLAAERQNRKEHNALAHMFGAPFAAQYLDQFLFGSPEQGLA